ncbi:HTH domain-containing protein [Halopiger djelfimassiliensis]|uniref:HTH domain-containing protein n=1 Tax=Halopiger djelfimassiliensis TaxID=1293047 RepID=UPI0006782229|nr:HTH domain-containing protein [Halopiger djelfimassiliensis]
MPTNNSRSMDVPAADIDAERDLRVDCYVRATVPAPITETINRVIVRLQQLCEAGSIADYRITHWPPECHVVDETADDGTLTRDELVTEFEQWATKHGHSLEPAFRRHEVPSSPFEPGTGESHERVRVPIVALALSETATDAETEPLRGVVPYTDRSRSDTDRTYTVDDWLSTAEPAENGRFTQASRYEQPTQLEGQQ